MVLEKDKNLAILTHLTGFGNVFFPLGSIVLPFIIRETKKEGCPFIDKITKDVINFNLSYLLYVFVLKLLVVPFFVGSLFTSFLQFNTSSINISCDDGYQFTSLIGLLAIVKFVLIIKAVISVNKGAYYKYPYSINFFK